MIRCGGSIGAPYTICLDDEDDDDDDDDDEMMM